jgi:hypothetical protein
MQESSMYILLLLPLQCLRKKLEALLSYSLSYYVYMVVTMTTILIIIVAQFFIFSCIASGEKMPIMD